MLSRQTLKSLWTTDLQTQFVKIANRQRYSSCSGSESEAADLDAAREWYQQFKKSSLPEKLATTEYVKASGAGGQKTNKTSSKATTTWQMHALRGYLPKVIHQGLANNRYYVASSDSIRIHCDAHRNRTQNKDETHDRLYDEIVAIYKKSVPGITSLEQKKRVEALQWRIGHGLIGEMKIKKMDDAVFTRHLNCLKREKVTRKKEARFKRHLERIEECTATRTERDKARELKMKGRKGIRRSDYAEEFRAVFCTSKSNKKSENIVRLKLKKQHGDKKRARSGGGGRGDY